REKLGRAARGKERDVRLAQGPGVLDELDLVLERAGGQQNAPHRQAVTDGDHRFEKRFGKIVAETADFARGAHLDAGDRRGALHAREAELRPLDTDVYQIEEAAPHYG